MNSRPRAEHKQRVRTPLVLQMHSTECGAACLGAVLAYHGRWVPLQELRKTCSVGRDGSNAADIVEAARHYGLVSSGWRRDTHELHTMSFPLILYWEFSHFVVLEGIGRDRFYLNDPAVGHRTVNADTFDRGFTGVALTFEPGPQFERSGSPPGILRRLRPWFRGAASGIVFAVASGIMLALLSLATPLILGVFVDHVFAGAAPWGGLLAGILAACALLTYVLTWFKETCLHSLSIRLSVIGSDHYLSRLLRVDTNFFYHRFAGDLAGRIQSIDKIAAGMSNQFLNVLIELGISVIFLIVMLFYAPILTAYILGLAGLNIALMRMVTRMRVEENHLLRYEQGMLLGSAMSGLRHQELLNATGHDDSFFSRWGGYQARELAARQRFTELGHVNTALPGLFNLFGNAVVLLLGAMQVMAGEMTLGTLMSFYVIAGMFLAPVGRFVEFADRLQTLEAEINRLDDIAVPPETPRLADAATSADQLETVDGRLRLAGRVELRNVTFGYNRKRSPLIDDFSLIIEPGQRVAIVGASGSGKSTLSYLIAGIHEPWSGEVLFDGIPLSNIPHQVLLNTLSLVDQHIALFAATIRENLTLWNPAVPDDAVLAAARDACIHDEIVSRPLGYDTPVDEGGQNFSGGQRQRLEIARALVNRPSILILDEATSALDTATEEMIDQALRRRGASCLIIAHRLSTIRDSDQIIVLEKGRIVQRGTHDSLMQDPSGEYSKLIRSDIGGA